MPDDKLKKLHATLVKDGYQMPDYSTFASDMKDETKRAKLWNNIQSSYELPDFSTFSDELGFAKKKELSGNGSDGGSTEAPAKTTSTSASGEQSQDFTTRLSATDEAKFQQWKSALPENLQNEDAYDLRGLYKSNPNAAPSDNGHFPDTYKKPNHPTFSDESVYFNDATKDQAGKWTQEGDNWVYTPYNPNVKMKFVEADAIRNQKGKVSVPEVAYSPFRDFNLNKIGTDNTAVAAPKQTKEFIQQDIAKQKDQFKSFVENPVPSDVDVNTGKTPLAEKAIVKAAANQKEASQMRNSFSSRFYNGELSADDIELIKQNNPLAIPEEYANISNEELASKVNQKTANLRTYSNAVRSLGADSFATEREALDRDIQDQEVKARNLEEGNYLSIPEEKAKYDKYLANVGQMKARRSQLEKDYYNKEYLPAKDKAIDRAIGLVEQRYGGKSVDKIFDDVVEKGFGENDVLQWTRTGTLSDGSKQKLQEIMNKAIGDDPVIRSYFQGTDRSFKDAPQLEREFVDYFNYVVPAQRQMRVFNENYSKQHPELAPILNNIDGLNQYLSSKAYQQNEASIKASLDKEYAQLNLKYSTQLGATQQYQSIVQKWTERVNAKTMPADQAQREIESEIQNNPALKKILDSRDKDVDALRVRSNQFRENYLVNSVKGLPADLKFNSDGSIGIKGIEDAKMKEMLDTYNKDYSAGFNTEIDNILSSEKDDANRYVELQKMVHNKLFGPNVGDFTFGLAAGVKTGGRSMLASTARWLYHKTGVGGDEMRYFETLNENTSYNKSDLANEHFRYKGLESLLEPSYYGYATGQSIPYMAPAIAVSVATGGGAAGAVLGGLAGGGIEAFQNQVNTYNDLYRDGINENGVKITSSEASKIAADQFADEVLPNMVLQALEFGTIMRGKSFVKPTLGLRGVGKGIVDVLKTGGLEAVQEGYQGFLQYGANKKAQGAGEPDLFDYMQTDDFRQNFFGGLAGGIAFGGSAKPGQYLDRVNNWKKMMESGRKEFNDGLVYQDAMQHEKDGNGASFRDALRLMLSNEQFKNDAEKATIGQTLRYSERLAEATKKLNVEPGNITGLYAAHNSALADMYDELSNVDEKKSSTSKYYAARSREHQQRSEEALRGDAKIYYVTDEQNAPLFLDEATANVFEQEGILRGMYNGGLIQTVNAINDNSFVDRVQKQFAQPVQPAQAAVDINPDIKREDVVAQIQKSAEAENVSDIFRNMALQNPDGVADFIYEQATGTKQIVDEQGQMKTVSSRDEVDNTFGKDVVDNVVAFKEQEKAKAKKASEETQTDVYNPGLYYSPVIGENIEVLSHENGRVAVKFSDNTEETFDEKDFKNELNPSSQDKSELEARRAFLQAQYPDVVHALTESDLPQEVQDEIKQRGFTGKVDGLVHNGKVYFITDKIASPRAAEKLYYHEAVGHLSVRDEVGNNALNKLSADFKIDNELSNKIANEYFNKKFSELTDKERAEVAQEYIANVAENGAIDVSFWDAIKSIIKQLLRSVGLSQEVTDSEVSAIVLRAYRRNLKATRGQDVRFSLSNKPSRLEGESMAAYAKRIVEWKKGRLNDTFSQDARKDIRNDTASETEYVKQLKEGKKILSGNINTPLQEFNQKLGLPEGDYETYVAALKEVMSENKTDKTIGHKIVQELRNQDPKNVLLAEIKVLKLKYTAESKGSRAGYRQAQEESKKAFAEYRIAAREKEKTKIEAVKKKYEDSLILEKLKREDMISKQKKYREDVAQLLSDVNELQLLDGKKFSPTEVLRLANSVNKVMSDKTFDNLADLVNEMITDAEHVRKVLQAKQLSKDVRKLLKGDFITANDVAVLKGLISLNPEAVTDIDEYNKILNDVVASRYAEPNPLRTYSNEYIESFIATQREAELRGLVDKADALYREFFTEAGAAQFFKENVMIGFPKPDAFRTWVEGTVVDPTKSHKEKKNALNQYEDFVRVMRQYTQDFEKMMEVNNAGFSALPQIDFAETIGDITNAISDSATSGGNRMVLEDMARDLQSVIDPNEPSLQPWQKELLSKLKDIDVTGMSSNKLRQFMNVVNNVVDNEDESGSGLFEAIYEANNKEAGDFLKFLNETGYKVRERVEKSFVKNKLRGLKEGISSTEMMFMQIANNSPQLAVHLYNMVRMNEIKKGHVQTLHEFKEMVMDPLNELIQQGLRQDADTNIRLTIYSRLRQAKETQSLEEARKEFVKRLNELERDIAVKEQFGKDADKQEALLILKVMDELRDKIMAQTGVNIAETKEGLTSDVMDKIEFLSPEQKQAYDLMRAFYDTTRPEFERLMTKYFNEQFEAWNNYMPDSHRKLRGGVINEDVNADNFGQSVYMRTANPLNAISGALNQRVQGNRIVEPKLGEDTNVINYNWFGANTNNAEEMLFDKNTAEHRMVADNVFKNKDVEDAIGIGNMEIMKEALVKELRTMTGLFGKNSAKWFTLAKDATDTFVTLAAKFQLYSLGALFKQGISAFANTALFLGRDAGHLAQVARQYEFNEDMQRLVSQEEVAIRGTTRAGTNIQSARNVAEVNQRVTGSDFHKTYKAAVDKLNGRNDLTGDEKRMMGWFLEKGDVIGARYSWVALYGTWLVKNGKYKSFGEINWKEEADKPNREAESYAQIATARQLNVNSRNALGEALTTPDAASSILKALYGLFAMFGFNKSIYLWNNFKTLTSGKPDGFSDEQRAEELQYARKSFIAGAAEEFAYQSTKALWVKLTLLPLFGMLLGAVGEDDKTVEAVTGNYNKNLWQKIISNTVSNYFFSFAGNTGQVYINEWMNDLYHQFGGKSNIFYEPPANPNFQANQGLWGATFQNLYKTSSEWLRINFDRNNNYLDKVPPPSAREQAWHGVSVLHNLLQMAKLGDADIGRLIQSRMSMMEKDISKRYQDPYYVDIYEMGNKPRVMSIVNRKILLNETDWDFYRDRFQDRVQELRKIPDARMTKAAKQRDASDYAKKKLLQEYGIGYLTRYEYDEANKKYKHPEKAK